MNNQSDEKAAFFVFYVIPYSISFIASAFIYYWIFKLILSFFN